MTRQPVAEPSVLIVEEWSAIVDKYIYREMTVGPENNVSNLVIMTPKGWVSRKDVAFGRAK